MVVLTTCHAKRSREDAGVRNTKVVCNAIATFKAGDAFQRPSIDELFERIDAFEGLHRLSCLLGDVQGVLAAHGLPSALRDGRLAEMEA